MKLTDNISIDLSVLSDRGAKVFEEFFGSEWRAGLFEILRGEAFRENLFKDLSLVNYTITTFAKADPEIAKFLLKDKFIAGEFLKNDVSNALCRIAESHPETAKFILQDEKLRKKLLVPGFGSYFLSKIAKSHPDSAQFILQNTELAEVLFSGYVTDILREIAASHIKTKEFILKDPALRVRFGEKLDKIIPSQPSGVAQISRQLGIRLETSHLPSGDKNPWVLVDLPREPEPEPEFVLVDPTSVPVADIVNKPGR